MEEWKPIETAPKDGVWVLLGRSDWDKPHIGIWTEYAPMEDWNMPDPRWEKDGEGLPLHGPTHWMPLPEPPK